MSRNRPGRILTLPMAGEPAQPMAEFEDLDVAEADVASGSVASAAEAVLAALMAEAAVAGRNGDLRTALDTYANILEMAPGNPDALLASAALCRLMGRPRDALRHCLPLLEVTPDHFAARLELAESLGVMERFHEAHAVLDLLLHEWPDAPETWHGLARLLAAEGFGDTADICLRRALALDPAHLPARVALARNLAGRGDHDGAVETFHHAIALASDTPAHYAGMAASLLALGRLDEAAEHVERALALDDEVAEARVVRADLAVIDGRLEESWDDAAARWQLPGVEWPALPGQPWEGENPAGAILLLFTERGPADTVMMARFIPLLVERGAHVVLRVQRPLVTLLTGLAGVERVVADDRPLPEDIRPDLSASLLDLPRLLKIGQADIPALPYLVPPQRRRPVVVPVGTAITLGLAWSGERPEGDVPLARLLRLAEIPGVVAFGLDSGTDAVNLADPSLVTDLGPTIGDATDLAARIAEMDLVIATDGTCAHLAGALGKPVWLMLPAAAGPHWMRGRDDTPWYPAMRLFRQDRPGDWGPVVERIAAALAALAAERTEVGAAARRNATGVAAAQTAFFAAHLQAGDLLLDLGAGDGRFSLDAADHDSGAVRVLALEPCTTEADSLRDAVALSGSEAAVEVVAAAAGNGTGDILAARTPIRGRRIFELPDWVPGTGKRVSVDDLLTERSDLANHRLVVRLGQTGWEEEILDGLRRRLDGGQIAVVAFEHRPEARAAETLAELGFSLWRFPDQTAKGALVPMSGESGAVLALAPGLAPADHYGPAWLPPSDAEITGIRAKAERMTRDGMDHHGAGRLTQAAEFYGEALMLDPFAAGANANKAVLLNTAGRPEAAAACFGRAVVREMIPAVAANLGAILRELHRFDQADEAYARALAAEPDNPRFLYGLAQLRREEGRIREALDLLERVHARRPDAAWALAQTRLAAGDMAGGLALLGSRPAPPPPSPETEIWTGDALGGRTLLVHDHGDIIDTLMLARFIPPLAALGTEVTVACVPELAPLMAELPGVVAVTSGDDPLPVCDLRAALTSLPRLLGPAAVRLPAAMAYLSLPAGMRPRRIPANRRLRVGVTWNAGAHTCPLAAMLALAVSPDLTLIALTDEVGGNDIDAIGADALIDRPQPLPADLAEAACVIAGLDVVIGGDTAELHLAAAMGKPAWVLLPDRFTWRWPLGRDDSPWYPTARIFRPSPDGSWREPVERIAAALAVLAAAKHRGDRATS